MGPHGGGLSLASAKTRWPILIILLHSSWKWSLWMNIFPSWGHSSEVWYLSRSGFLFPVFSQSSWSQKQPDSMTCVIIFLSAFLPHPASDSWRNLYLAAPFSFFNLDSFTNSEEPLGATREPSSSVSDQSLMFQRLELDFFLFLYLSVYSFIILFIFVSCSFFLSLE